MTEIDKQIAELEKQKQQLVQEEAKKKEEEWRVDVRRLIGKCFKAVSSVGYRDRVNTNYIKYIKVLGYRDLKTDPTNKAQIAVRVIDIACTPIGWTRKEGNKLQYVTGQNNLKVTKPEQQYPFESLESGKRYNYPFLELHRINKDGIVTGYNLGEWWIDCTEQEYNEVDQKCSTLSKEFYDQMIPYASGPGNYNKPCTEQTEEMILTLDEASLKRIDDLITSKINVEQLVNTLSGKVAKYNYFNNTQLPELAQYQLYRDKGLSLNIVGGDDGTDYEPYTTKYYITSIEIDWKTILYPIRTKLDSVLGTEKDLLALKSIYSPNSWDCNYDTSSYDATFISAKLKPSYLKEVNETIKKHIK